MQIAIHEKDRKAGVYYAVTEDGIELPVIDVTHPAFAIQISESELDRLLQEHIRSVKGQSKLSAFVQPLFLRLISRRSMIMRGIMDAAGGFMSGLNTYILRATCPQGVRGLRHMRLYYPYNHQPGGVVMAIHAVISPPHRY